MPGSYGSPGNAASARRPPPGVGGRTSGTATVRAAGTRPSLAAVGAVPIVASVVKFPELGYWFCVLAVITACGALASLGQNLGCSACSTGHGTSPVARACARSSTRRVSRGSGRAS